MTETVRVEAGYLMLFDLEFERAMDFFLRCPSFQPAELFPFFPEHARRWLRLAQPKRYWGLHAPPQVRELAGWR
jgi:hypothetical protein